MKQLNIDDMTLFESGDPFARHGRQVEKPVTIAVAVPLKDLNLEDELASAYARAKALLDRVEFEDSISTQHKVSAVKTITDVLGQVVKMRQELLNLKEMATITTTLANTLKEFPEVKAEFLRRYKGNLCL